MKNAQSDFLLLALFALLLWVTVSIQVIAADVVTTKSATITAASVKASSAAPSTQSNASLNVTASASVSSNDSRLLFDKPAASFQFALPQGNGALLASCLGSPLLDKIQLSENLLWVVSQPISVLKSAESSSGCQIPYRPVAEIVLSFPGHASVKSYSREFDFKTAVTTVKYTVNGVVYTREYLTSSTDSVVIIHLKASKPKSITLSMNMNALLPKSSVVGMEDLLLMTGSMPSAQNKQIVLFQTLVKPLVKNGLCLIKKGVFTIKNADEVTLYASVSTNLNENCVAAVDETDRSSRILNRAFGRDFNSMKQRHLVGYRAGFESVILHLGSNTLATQNYQFGRYLSMVLGRAQRIPEAKDGLLGMQRKVKELSEQYFMTGNSVLLKEQYPQIKLLIRRVLQYPVSGDVAFLHNSIVLYDLYSQTLLIGDALNGGIKNLFASSDKVFLDSVRTARSKLPELEVDKEGNLNFSATSTLVPLSYGPMLAGMASIDTRIVALDAVYPGSRISPFKSAEIAQAAQKTMLQASSVGVSVASPLDVERWARLHDGNQALKQLQQSWKIYDAKNEFNIESCIRNVSSVNEMLLQSKDGALFILPALPDAWKEGTIKGLSARGGFVVDMTWSKGELELLTIKATLDGVCRIRSRVSLNGKNLKVAKNSNPNPLLRNLDITDDAGASGRFQLYDLKMVAGETVTLTH
jgi:hypothetical protein